MLKYPEGTEISQALNYMHRITGEVQLGDEWFADYRASAPDGISFRDWCGNALIEVTRGFDGWEES